MIKNHIIFIKFINLKQSKFLCLIIKSNVKGHIHIKYKLVLKWPIYYPDIASGFIFKKFSIIWNWHSGLKYVLSFHQLLLLWSVVHQLIPLQSPTHHNLSPTPLLSSPTHATPTTNLSGIKREGVGERVERVGEWSRMSWWSE